VLQALELQVLVLQMAFHLQMVFHLPLMVLMACHLLLPPLGAKLPVLAVELVVELVAGLVVGLVFDLVSFVQVYN